MYGIAVKRGMYTNFDYMFKVVLIGDSGVGKTNLFKRFIFKDDVFKLGLNPNYGVDSATRDIHIDDDDDKIIARAEIWDTASADITFDQRIAAANKRKRMPASVFYKRAGGAILVYDITNHSTFENAERWLKQIRDHTETNTMIMLLGNKTDAQQARVVSTDEAKAFAEKENILFTEASCLDPLKVDNAFTQVVTQIYHVVSKSF